MKTIPFGAPQLDESEQKAVAEVLAGPQLVHGPKAAQFEKLFAERIGVAHAISVSSCTAGLHLGLHAHDIGPGDSVVVPAMTHVATAHAVEYCKARPVFVDVRPESGNLDYEALYDIDTDDYDVKAIIPVHYLGLPCEMEAIMKAAEYLGAFVMEDCATSLDATYEWQKTGSIGLLGCFSFYPAKHMTTAEGGMITTNDERLAQKLKKLKAFGYDKNLNERSVPGLYDVIALGYNYRMSEIHSAIGLAQMQKLDWMQEVRARNYQLLKIALTEIEELTIFAPRQGKAVSSHYCLNATLPNDHSVDRKAVIAYLQNQGIGTSIHYPGPVPMFTYYREKYGYLQGQFPIAEWLAEQTISLPVAPHITEDDILTIARHMKEAIKAGRQ